jgi:hypothetical protein
MSWAHVRAFSPWEVTVDRVAARMLEATGWKRPPADDYPTGGELVGRYLEPLAALPQLSAHIRLGARVTAVSRLGLDRLKSDGRERAPFVLHVSTAAGDERVLARAVIDASGSVGSPNPLGADGLPAMGERALAERIHYGIPDVLGRDRARYAGRRTLVVGSGHSAFTALLDLVALGERVPGTVVLWGIRRQGLDGLFGGGDADALPARGRLGQRLRALVAQQRMVLFTGLQLDRLTRTEHGIVAISRGQALPAVDEVVATTGFRPDLAMLRELRLSIDPIVESPAALAPVIDPNVHSCGTVPPHGEDVLRQPEPGFYLAGMKSYGRAPNFLMLTGYEQVRSIACALTGDEQGARQVELVLPPTGVCRAQPLEADPVPGAAAEACCGGPAPAGVEACCVLDADAKAAGEPGCGCATSAAHACGSTPDAGASRDAPARPALSARIAPLGALRGGRAGTACCG